MPASPGSTDRSLRAPISVWPSAFSSEGAFESTGVERHFHFYGRPVGQLRHQAHVLDLHPFEVESLTEAGDEGVERRLKPLPRWYRRRDHPELLVDPDFSWR